MLLLQHGRAGKTQERVQRNAASSAPTVYLGPLGIHRGRPGSLSLACYLLLILAAICQTVIWAASTAQPAPLMAFCESKHCYGDTAASGMEGSSAQG